MNPSSEPSSNQELFALENLAEPSRAASGSNYNFLGATRKTLAAIRKHKGYDEGAAELARLILEFSYACGRKYAYFKHQNYFSQVLQLDEGQCSRALTFLLEKKIIIRAGGYYAFRPHKGWRLSLRVSEGSQNEVNQIELMLEFPGEQHWLPREMHLDDQEIEEFLSSASVEPVEPGSSPVEPRSTRSESRSPPIEPGSSPSRAHILKEDLKVQDSKLKALNARNDRISNAERIFMERLMAVLPSDVYENDGGKWRERYRKQPAKAGRVLAAIEEDLKGGLPIRKPGGHMEDLWKRFAD